MTPEHIAETALVLSAATVLFSGNTWYVGRRERTARLMLKIKPGKWSRKHPFLLTTTIIIFNPSTRANCIQSYSLRVKNADGTFTDFGTESIRIANSRFSGSLGDPLHSTPPEAFRLIQRQFGRIGGDVKDSDADDFVQINPLPLSVPPNSGVEVEVGTVDFDASRGPRALEIEIRLKDIYDREYEIAQEL